MFQRNQPDTSHLTDHHSVNRDDVETVVGPSVTVEGDFSSEGNIVVKGTVAGSVKTSRLLTVEGGAKIMANVRAGEALVSGQIKGNVRVDDRLELTETAHIFGDIICQTLVVAAGARLFGKVSMKGAELEESKTRVAKSKNREGGDTEMPLEA